MNNAGLADGMYWVERTPGQWSEMVIENGEVYWLVRRASIMNPQTMRQSVRGPLLKPGAA